LSHVLSMAARRTTALLLAVSILCCALVFVPANARSTRDRKSALRPHQQDRIRMHVSKLSPERQHRALALISLSIEHSTDLEHLRTHSSVHGQSADGSSVNPATTAAGATSQSSSGQAGSPPDDNVPEPTPYCNRVMNTWLSTCVFGPGLTTTDATASRSCQRTFNTWTSTCLNGGTVSPPT